MNITFLVVFYGVTSSFRMEKKLFKSREES